MYVQIFFWVLVSLSGGSDAPCFVPQGLPLCVHLLDQHFSFASAFLPGVGVDAFGVFGAVRQVGE